MSGCVEDRVDRDLVALDDAEHALGHAGLAQELGDEHRGGRVLLGRLEDERVAAREGVAEHPHRHHGREVERRDARHDAQRLADLVHVDARRGLLAEPALQQVRHAARELEVLEAAGDLAQRVGRDLAVLGGQQRRDVPSMVVDEVPDLEQDLGPLRERGRAPARERRLGRGHGRVQLLGRREVDPFRLRSRGRIEHGPAPARPARDRMAADPVPHGRKRGGRRVLGLGELGHGCLPGGDLAVGVRPSL